MSMISQQCERLRNAAEDLRRRVPSPFVSTVPLTTALPIADAIDYAEQMYDAADLIEQLRDDLQSIRTEDAKLLEGCTKWMGKAAQLEEENKKLRELVRHMGACIQYLDRSDEDGGCVLCPYQSVEHDCEFESRMLELGIEV